MRIERSATLRRDKEQALAGPGGDCFLIVPRSAYLAKMLLAFSLLFSASAFSATGSLSGGVCFETAQEASDSYYSTKSPVSWIDPSGVSNVRLIQPSGAGFADVLVQNGVVVSSTPITVVQPLPSCQAPSEYYSNGMQWGAALVGLLGLSFGVRASIKALA